jgi:ribosomal protein S7
LGKFINRFVKQGKRHVVEKEFNKVYKFAKLNSKMTVVTTFLQAVEKTRPTFILKSRRVGAKTKEYPVFISAFRQRNASIKNIKNICENRKE